MSNKINYEQLEPEEQEFLLEFNLQNRAKTLEELKKIHENNEFFDEDYSTKETKYFVFYEYFQVILECNGYMCSEPYSMLDNAINDLVNKLIKEKNNETK